MPRPDHASRCRGALLGVALADALGAPFEGSVGARIAWAALGLLRRGVLRYTDDGEMTLGAAESLVACQGFDPDHLARTWAERVSATRGYGGGARRVLERIRAGQDWRVARTAVFRDGSFGNGAAMRVAPIALAFVHRPERLDAALVASADITHGHPIGRQGALLVGRAVALAHRDVPAAELLATPADLPLAPEYTSRLAAARALFAAAEPDPGEVAGSLGRGVFAHESVVTALYVAARCYDAPFEQLVDASIAIGGDVDTIAAMAAGIWGAHRGDAPLPREPLARLEDADRFRAAADALAALRV